MSPIQKAAWAKIMEALILRGGGEEDLRKVVQGRAIANQIAGIIKDGIAPRTLIRYDGEEIEILEKDFTVVVNCNMKYWEMLEAGHYDSTGSLENKRFRIRRKDLWTASLVLVKFKHDFTLEQAEIILRLASLLPAKKEEFLAFGAQHPEVQREHDIITPAWHWQYDNFHQAVPCLSSSEDGKERIVSIGLHYKEIHRFHLVLARRRIIKK